MISATIEGRRVEVGVGSPVENAAGRTELLLASDWDAAMFRFPNPVPDWATRHAIAVNVEITGRTFRRRRGAQYVKLRLEWVGDGEPSTYSDGWLLADPWTLPYVEETP